MRHTPGFTLRRTSGFTLIEILTAIAAILGVIGMVITAILGVIGVVYTVGYSEGGYKPKDTPSSGTPVEPPRFIATQVLEGGLNCNPVLFHVRDTKTGQEWLGAHQYGFVQVSPAATTPAPLRCEAEVTR